MGQTAPRHFTQPLWDGLPLESKTLLVYAEIPHQGFGDTLQFVRYVPQIQRSGGKIFLMCQPALLDLLSGIKGVDGLFPIGAPLPPFDVQIALIHLPAVFGTTLATIPSEIPYLKADSQRIKHWKAEINQQLSLSGEPKATASGRPVFKIGIAWQGSLNQKNDTRSIPLAQFANLAKVPGVRLLSLHLGPGVVQLASAAFPITALGSRFDKSCFSDLAAVLPNLDLVVTVDTAVAHLAGALGVPVWVALTFHPDWRWLLERSDCPWYPTMRLFRQSKLGEWPDVFTRIRQEILSILKKKRKMKLDE